jgi:aryl-alcohol dehydrogenase-like predicted oxidoreductase
MRYRRLGRTDIQVSSVCLGGWSLVGDSTWGDQDPAQSVAAIHAALEAGINTFDTAEAYGGGASEELLGKALGARRKDVIIASKVSQSNLQGDRLRQACERSLRCLKTDYIDLYQMHWPSPSVPPAEALAAMQDLQRRGKVRVIGVSNFGVSFLPELLAAGRVESNQLAYSLLWRAIEYEVQPLCVRNDLSILCYSPLCQGLLTGKFRSADEVPPGRARTRLFCGKRPQSRHGQGGAETETFQALATIRQICAEIAQPMGRVALAWLLAQPGVTSVIAGARNADQARENALAAELELPADVLRRFCDATEPVKRLLGRNADMWQADTRMERPDSWKR